MPLTDRQAVNAKPEAREYKLTDEKGLYLLVKPTGGKYWRLKYRIHGKERKFAIGVYPEVSLREARAARDEARKLISDGVDPSTEKQARNMSRPTPYRLTRQQSLPYPEPALAKSSAGIRTPFQFSKVPTRRRIASFFVGQTHAHLPVLAGRVGQPSGWPVSLEAGSANPIRSASHSRFAPPGSGLTAYSEEVPMAVSHAARPDYRSADSDTLPFIDPAVKRWTVPATDDYAEACFKGREYAAHLVEYLAQNPDSAPLLQLIAADIDFADQSDSKGYQVGFFEFIENCLRVAAHHQDLWSQGQRYNRHYRERLAVCHEEAKKAVDAPNDAPSGAPGAGVNHDGSH